MSGSKIISGSVFLAVLIAAFTWFPRSGFPEDKSAGFYAGPLSIVVETVVSTSKFASKSTPQEEEAKLKNAQDFRSVKGERSEKHDEEHPLSSPA